MSDNDGIIPAAQVLEIKSKAARRQARYRANLELAKQKRKAESDAVNQTPDRFWEKNRSAANQTKIEKYLEQQERVLDQLHWMETQVKGTGVPPSDIDYVSLEEGAADVTAFVAEYGICQMEIIWLKFWLDAETREGFIFELMSKSSKASDSFLSSQKGVDVFSEITKHQDATAVFAKYGIVTAVPGHRLHAWQTWLRSRQAPKPQPLNRYTSLQCVCGSLPSAISQAIADTYREKNIPYRCHECIRKERSSNAAVGKALAVEYKQPESSIFDSWGRVKL